MDAFQYFFATVFIFEYVFLFARNILRGKATIVGTGGTIMVPALAFVLVILISPGFYFSGNYTAYTLAAIFL